MTTKGEAVKFIALILAASPAWCAGSVQQTVSKLGETNQQVLSFRWTGDASTGSVPTTAAQGLNCCQGWAITQVVITPGTPAPTSGYSVTLKDANNLDIIEGAATSLSATATSNYAISSSVPPLEGSLTLSVTGQSVASAAGVVRVVFSKPGSANLSRLNGLIDGGALQMTYRQAQTGGVTHWTKKLLGSPLTSATNERFRNPVFSTFCTNPTALNAVCNYLSGIYRGILVLSIANGNLTSVVVSGGTAMVTTTVAHGLVTGNEVHVSGCNTFYRLHCAVRAAVTVTDSTHFTYSTSAANGTYTDAGLAIYPNIAINSDIRTFDYRTIFSPPEQAAYASDAGGLGIQGTGGQISAWFYRNPEFRPSGYEDWSYSAQGPVEIGHSTPGQGDLTIVGTCIGGGGSFGLDNTTPLTKAGGTLTSVVVNGSGVATFTATVDMHVSVGGIYVLSGATVDPNLGGIWEVITTPTARTFTATKIPLSGVTNPAAGTYTDAGLSLALPGCEVPYQGWGKVIRMDSGLSQGLLIQPYANLFDTGYQMRTTISGKKWAWAVGAQQIDKDPIHVRGGMRNDGTLYAYRGNTDTDSYGNPTPVSGVLKTTSSRTTVANTTTQTNLLAFTVPPMLMEAGRTIRVRLTGVYSKVNAGHTLTLSLVSNAFTHVDFVDGVASALTNAPIDGEWLLNVGTTGTPNGLESSSRFQFFTGSPQISAYGTPVINFDPAATNQFYVKATWSVANAGNTVSATIAVVEVLN